MIIRATAFCLLACVGCGQNLPSTAPVSGRVTYQGKPVVKGNIMFRPEHGRAAGGVIGPDGRYTLTTFDPGDGATLGPHRVTIDAWQASGDQITASIHWLVPEKYSRPATSPLTADVKEGENTIDFDLPVTGK